ncbi:MAG: phytoene desaturase family protein, partial [Pseudonocardiaceae bacterium]
MRVLVVGGGHNGLVAGCYLARSGAQVLVLEQADRLGGGCRTDELVAGYRFNTHSAAHNIINATDIVADLRLRAAGLEYREMDPFSVAVFADGTTVRFHRDVEATVASIAELDPAEAMRYRAWMRDTMPVVTLMRSALEAGAGWPRRLRQLPRRAGAVVPALARNGGPLGLARLLVSPYARVLTERLGSDLVRAPVSAFAAHASAAPQAPGSAVFALWQAFYHQVGQWHAVGGSQGLVDALAHRLSSYGGSWRTGAPVARITRAGDQVRGVVLESGEHLSADAVLTTLNPRTALLELLDPPLDGPEADRLRGAHRGNVVQMLVLLATTALPAYPGGRPGDHHGLQSYVDTLDTLSAGFAQAQAGWLPENPVPTYAFTPSALDDTIAPASHHTVYLACPSVPYRLRCGWAAQAD